MPEQRKKNKQAAAADQTREAVPNERKKSSAKKGKHPFVWITEAGTFIFYLIIGIALCGFFFNWIMLRVEEHSFPVHGEMINVKDGVRLNSICLGPENPDAVFVFLTGSRATMFTMMGVLENIQSKASNIRLCIYNRRNQATSVGPRNSTAAEQIEDLHYLIHNHYNKNNKPLVLVGWSIGGLVSMVYSVNHPEDVNGIVLLDSIPVNIYKGSGQTPLTRFFNLMGVFAATGITRISQYFLPPLYPTPAKYQAALNHWFSESRAWWSPDIFLEGHELDTLLYPKLKNGSSTLNIPIVSAPSSLDPSTRSWQVSQEFFESWNTSYNTDDVTRTLSPTFKKYEFPKETGVLDHIYPVTHPAETAEAVLSILPLLGDLRKSK